MEKKVGKGNIFSAVVHMDEKTPHLHLCFTPITEDGRLETHLGQMKKYQATIDYLTQENEGLKEKVSDGSSIKRKMEVIALKQENETLWRFVDSIPPEVMQVLKQQQRGHSYKNEYQR